MLFRPFEITIIIFVIFSVYSVMHKYLTEREEVNFDKIFDQKIGKCLSFQWW